MLWDQIRTARSEMNTDAPRDIAIAQCWGRISIAVDGHFRDLVCGENTREKLWFFVEQFGKHGPQADMRWLLAEPRATLTSGHGKTAGLYPVGD